MTNLQLCQSVGVDMLSLTFPILIQPVLSLLQLAQERLTILHTTEKVVVPPTSRSWALIILPDSEKIVL